MSDSIISKQAVIKTFGIQERKGQHTSGYVNQN
jgi:hypothetical protein